MHYFLFCLVEAYFEALQIGSRKVSYIGVMFMGCGGVGKSSLLLGLKNKPLLKEANSTLLANVSTLIEWAVAGETRWEDVTEEEELDEMAHILLEIEDEKERTRSIRSNATDKVPDVSGREIQEDEKVGEEVSVVLHSRVTNTPITTATTPDPSVEAIKSIMSKVSLRVTKIKLDRSQSKHSSSEPQYEHKTWMRVWDCGGQRMFRVITPAFLSSKTLFLLLFDARHRLDEMCVSSSYHNGKEIKMEGETPLTNLEFLQQWMALIHSHVSNKCGSVRECIIPVGTHGDAVANEEECEEILDAISKGCEYKGYASMVKNGYIVDNTTAGKGDKEDGKYADIRKQVCFFAKDATITVPTPSSWVLFRKVLNELSKKKAIPSLSEVKEIAKEIYIPESDVSSVLRFYHDRGVFFHYNDISNLKDKVVADPHRLIQIIARLLPLNGFEDKLVPTHEWAKLRDYGIMEKKIYEKILKDEMSNDDIEPQAIIDLLNKMLIMAETCGLPEEDFPYSGNYFVPCMLQLCPTEPTSERATAASTSITPAPLYMMFTTKYLPPGFFIRFAALLSEDSKCQLYLKGKKIYQDHMVFKYGEINQGIDQITITEEKSSIRIEIKRIKNRRKGCPFLFSTCLQIVGLLRSISEKVLDLMLPSVKMCLYLKCENCSKPPKDGWIKLPLERCDLEPFLDCENCNKSCILNSEHGIWLDIKDVRNVITFVVINNDYFSLMCRVHQIPYRMSA